MSCVWWPGGQPRSHTVDHLQTFDWEPDQISAVEVWDAHRLQQGPEWWHTIQGSMTVTYSMRYRLTGYNMGKKHSRYPQPSMFPCSFIPLHSSYLNQWTHLLMQTETKCIPYICILHLLCAGITSYTQCRYLIVKHILCNQLKLHFKT